MAPRKNVNRPAEKMDSSGRGTSVDAFRDRRLKPGRPDRNTARASLLLLTRTFFLLALAAVSAPLSQLSMSPVYGSIPTSLYQSSGMLLLLLITFGTLMVRRDRRPSTLALWVPVLALWIPTIQFYIFRLSSSFGAVYGPIITNALTVYPLSILSSLASGYLWTSQDAPDFVRSPWAVLVMMAYQGLEQWMSSTSVLLPAVQRLTSSGRFLSRSGLQLLCTSIYAVMFPSKLLLLTVPSVIHILGYNIHMPFPSSLSRLNETLSSESHYIILERKESLTGYISVLENTRDKFRVMRCDHSLLGGVWLQLPPGVELSSKVQDPIYAVFTMLEAVRLVDRTGADQQTGQGTSDEAVSEQALVIGLGIGTSPAALTTHGVNTTTVEIDPVVAEFAEKYFDLPDNHTTVVEDATTYLPRAKKAGLRYDYIIHDVFTGGAEPVVLFTFEFLTGLYDLLKPDGAIAINYAGDLIGPSVAYVVQTIQAVFPACRIFREDELPDHETVKRDFTNMVIFCTRSTLPLTFRRPVEADFLESNARRHYLLPEHEVSLRDIRKTHAQVGILTNQNMDVLAKVQEQSAVGHWEIMRTVLPDVVWESW